MMRTGLNYNEPQNASETDRDNIHNVPGASSAPARAALNSGLSETQSQVSGACFQVQALVTLASQLPEIRRDLVETLRQAVERGQYQVSPDDVAGALLAHVTAQRAA